MSETPHDQPVVVIESKRSWAFVDFRELNHYRDLLYFMVWRSIKVAYAQSVGGLAWALVQPAIQILVFTVIFGNLVDIGSDGLPYLAFFHSGDYPLVLYEWHYVGCKRKLDRQFGNAWKDLFPTDYLSVNADYWGAD